MAGLLLYAVGQLCGLLLYLWNSLWRAWSLLVIHINRFLLYFHLGGRSKTNRSLKAVLIGDGLAQGIGGGAGQLLLPSSLVHRLNLNYRNKANIRLDWTFFERGYYMSTTSDWLPTSRLFKRTFASRACRDVDLVIIMVGLQDIIKQHRQQQKRRRLTQQGAQGSGGGGEGKEQSAKVEEVEDKKQAEEEELLVPLQHGSARGGSSSTGGGSPPALNNLKAIITELRAQGRRVCVCDLPMVGKASGPLGRPIRAFNHALQEYIEDRLKDPKVVLARMSMPRVEAKRCWDGIHLNTQGYKALAGELLERIADQLVQAEWDVIRPQLLLGGAANKAPPPTAAEAGVLGNKKDL